MTGLPIVAIAIALSVMLTLVGVLIFLKRKGDMSTTDYRVFYILGLVWLPMGIATDNYAFTGLGAVFLIVGLANRDKWQDQKKL